MVCEVCGCTSFIPAEYVMVDGGLRAPALECTRCHALVLDQDAGATESERDSVELALKLRRVLIKEARERGGKV